jgi:hypothetical protein
VHDAGAADHHDVAFGAQALDAGDELAFEQVGVRPVFDRREGA